jgi:hypothetical protein
MSKSFFQLYHEAIGTPPTMDMPTRPLTAKVDDQTRIDLLNKWIPQAAQQFVGAVNNQLGKINASDADKKYFFTQVINELMKSGKIVFDIPGYGRVSRIGTGQRTYEKEKGLRKQQHTAHIRDQYQGLINKGMSDEQAINELKKMWRIVPEKETDAILNRILKDLRPKPDSVYDPENFKEAKKKYINFLQAAHGNKQQARNTLAQWLADRFPYYAKKTTTGNLYPRIQEVLTSVVNDIAAEIEGGRPMVQEDLPRPKAASKKRRIA